ncbi:MAG: hypothetical protein DRJ52_04685 [Thermoprotei archaeon]|nr:MAG: hypothetical protein DRJ52_04685 [Thermoprotei archaeon]RLE99979.1 MAG: hypothetical protein DRJ63_03670 [Thermoprotei archaeon]
MSLSLVENLFKEHGYSTEVSGEIKGLSGVFHKFDLIARRGDSTLCISFLKENFHVEFVVNFVRSIDLKSVTVIFLVREEDVKGKVCSTKNFRILVYRSVDDLVTRLKELINCL